jgi:alanyl-tRNA synthetase
LTTRLYYTDSYAREFDAIVEEIVTLGDRRAAILDLTAFYPTSGGQPFDTGTLGDARVLDVVDREDGAVLHVFDGVLTPGPVHGRIDWERRFEHMQQHTGQHVLSAAFEHACGARTDSFHLGTLSSTIDLGREVSAAQIAMAELEANRVVWEDRPVLVRFVDDSEAATLPLRKEPKRSGRLRIVEIEGIDLSACGGTHVSRTGAIGSIAVASSERFRGGTRIEFACGIRALASYQSLRDRLAAAGRLLSTAPQDVPAAIDRLLADAKVARARLKDLQEQLATHEAAAMVARATDVGGVMQILHRLDGWDVAGLKAIATAIADRPGHVAVLLDSAMPASIVVARAADVNVDAGALIKAVAPRFGGKGGGRPEFAQGGGLNAPADEILQALASELSQQLRR